MKQIEAVIDSIRLHEVRGVLEEMGIDDFTETTIRCHHKGQIMKFRGATFMATIIEKVKLEIIATDETVTGIIEAITAIVKNGRKEDCRIAIFPYLETAAI